MTSLCDSNLVVDKMSNNLQFTRRMGDAMLHLHFNAIFDRVKFTQCKVGCMMSLSMVQENGDA